MTVVESVGWVLVHFLWQGAAIAILLRLVLALAAPARPTLRYALGCGALALMVAAPAITAARLATTATPAPTAPLALEETPRDAHAASASNGEIATTTVDADAAAAVASEAHRADITLRSGYADPREPQRRASAWTLSSPIPRPIREGITAMLPWLVGAWAIGVMLLSVRLAGGWWRTRALRTRGIEAAPDACQRMATRLIARMRIARPVAFFVSSRVTAPIVFGHVKPVVLVPAAVLAGLTPSQLEAIFAHELAHVRRHDYLVNLLQTVIETVFFYHPAVWWVSRQVRQSREECCDDIAVAACGDRKDYVEALLGVEQMRHAAALAAPHAASAALGATDGSLLARARRLLLDTDRESATPRLTASAITIAIAGIALAGISSAATEPVMIERSLSQAAASSTKASKPSTSTSSESQAAKPAGPPRAVIAAPDPSAPFAARRAWAEREASQRRASRHWLGYAIRPVKGMPPIVYFDRHSMVMTSGGVKISGHMFSDRADGLTYRGQPLAIPDADPTAIKVLLLLDTRGSQSQVSRVHASTLPLPFDADDRPIFWIGAADAASSLQVIDGLYAAASIDLKKDLVSTVGIHDDSPTVVAWLDRRVQGTDADEVRAEAVEDLAWHPIPAALAALERAARQDRASVVRQEAAEALGDLKMPEAAPVLIALAKSLDDRDARREAIEALGERSEAAAADALTAIAREDTDVDLQREAVETLGDYKDGRGVAALQDILRTHPNPDVRREAIETLVDSAPPADALKLLRDVMQRETDSHVRREAVERIADINDGAARALLIDIARTHDSEDLRAEAVESLADVKMPAAEVVPVLKQIAMSDRALHVRTQAVEALANLPDGQGLDALLQIAREQTDRETRKRAMEALGDSEHPRARQMLQRILQ